MSDSVVEAESPSSSSNSTDRAVRRVKSEADVQPSIPSTPMLQSPTPAVIRASIELGNSPTFPTPRTNHEPPAPAIDSPIQPVVLAPTSRLRRWIAWGQGANKADKARRILVWNVATLTGQAIAIVVVLAVGSGLPSPTSPGLIEWNACEVREPFCSHCAKCLFALASAWSMVDLVDR